MTAYPQLRKLILGLATIAVMVAAACSSDSPSEPTRTPAPPPGSGGGGSAFNVTVSLSPGSAPVGSQDPVLVTVRAVRSDNGQAPPAGTTAVVSAPIGTFGTLGGPASVAVTLTSGVAQLQYFVPQDGTQPNVVIQASIGGSVGRATLILDEEANFFVSFVEPASGSPQGGDEVTINGGGFKGPARVLFGGVNAQVLSVSSTRIRVRTPASTSPPDQRSTVSVAVTIDVNGEDQASDTITGAFTYTPGGGGDNQPAIFTVTPGTGPNEGGTVVSIGGEGFTAPVQVEFGQDGTFLEAQVLSVNGNTIQVRTPAATGFGQSLQNQSVSIRVRNLTSGLTAIRANAYRFGVEVLMTGISPDRGPVGGGDTVTIFGQGFDAPVQVELGNDQQAVISVTGTEIVFRTAGLAGLCGNSTQSVSVTNLETGAVAAAIGGDLSYTYTILGFEPLIFQINPPSGPEGGNTQVTITGENLGNVLTTFGDRPATQISAAANGSQVVVRTPFLPRAEFATEPCDDNADGSQGERFIPTAVDVTVTDRITTCSVTFPDGFAYTPADSSCRNDVGPVQPDPECSDGVDNDGDTMVDFPADPECANADDDDESA